MQISLRSQMIAGTAAFVGASAVALTPVAPAMSLPALHAPSFAQVALAGFDSPITELLNSTVMATNYLFSSADPTSSADLWPFANFGTTLGGLPFLPASLGAAALGGYSSVGLLPQIIDDALPIISQLGYNGSDYLQVASTGLYGAAYSVSEGVWNFPGEVVTAVGELIGGDPAAAVQTLVDAVIGPVIQATSYLLISGGYIATGVINRAGALLASVPDILTGLIGTAIGIPSVLIGKTVEIASDIVTNLLSFDIEGAWNATVDGLLGPSGLPGTIINLTIGAGVQTGPISTPSGIAENFVPSVRTAVQSLVKTIAGDLATPVATSAAAVAPSAARAAAAAPEAAAVEAAPAAETTAGDSAPSAASARVDADAAAPAPTAAAASTAAVDNDAPAADAPSKGKAGSSKASRGGR